MIQNLKGLIETTGDIELLIDGVAYTILTWPDAGIVVARQGSSEDEQIFKNADALMENCIIGGKPIQACDIKVTFAA